MDFIKNSLLKTYPDEVSDQPFEKFNTKDAVVWIDPLDGTSDFVKGNLPACTVLIGLTINNYSRFGVVHNPFSIEDQDKSLTYFGSAEHGAFRMNYHRSMSVEETLKREITYIPPFNHEEEPAEDHSIRVAASL